MKSEIRVCEVTTRFSNETARTPLKFGTVVMDAAVLAEARIVVETRDGRRGVGAGAIFLSDVWAFPSPQVPHPVREAAMVELTRRCAKLLGEQRGYGHPIDLIRAVDPGFDDLAAGLSRELALAEPLPRLLTLVCASPLDAALHDAFGLANAIDTYDGYGPEFMPHDLGWYYGERFSGQYPSEFLRPRPVARVPIFHLVGGLDKLTRSELDDSDPRDDRPVCLEDWIARDGVYCLKVKLRGNDLVWDVERLLAVNRVAEVSLARRGRDELYLSADANEVCPSPDYVIELLAQVREASPAAFRRLVYVEQPTERDLRRYRRDMSALAKIVPVLADESLASDEALDLAIELGWSGPALKTCKGQTHAVLWAAKARALGLPYSIQDLTNPGLALVQSVGLAARTYPLLGVEYNSRQYFPDAAPAVRAVHTPAFVVQGGEVSTASLKGGGLGFQLAAIDAKVRERRMSR